MLVTKLFENLHELAIASKNLDLAEELILFETLRELKDSYLSFDESGSKIKFILELVYTDGIGRLEDVQVKYDKITSYFLT